MEKYCVCTLCIVDYLLCCILCGGTTAVATWNALLFTSKWDADCGNGTREILSAVMAAGLRQLFVYKCVVVFVYALSVLLNVKAKQWAIIASGKAFYTFVLKAKGA